ncbi:MAG: hypothetical protein EBZ51_05485 [Synechococcaceae bacterium WB9_2_112]|nr:hypothetical protein [Synechococcaceae bacterium WB9_2_112]
MNSGFDRRAPSLDTTQPGIRHIQDLIRQATAVRLVLRNGDRIEGVLRWQDQRYLAICPGEGQPLNLVNRDAVDLIRALI